MAKGKSGLTAPTVPTPVTTPQPQLTPGFEFLGPKGQPIDMDAAKTGSNPNWATGLEKWHRNCQRCVWAYEMQRRGYDVEARERILTGGDTLPMMYHRRGWASVAENGIQDLVSFTSYGTIKQMLTQMSSWGDGSRAIVLVRWTKGRGGHVFIAEQKGNGTIFLDPQTGRYVDINKYMSDAVKKETKLLRIDNKKLNAELLKEAVKIRGT